MIIDSIADIIKESRLNELNFAEVILKLDLIERKVTKEQSINEMTLLYKEMKNADANYNKNLRSNSKIWWRW